MYIVRIKEYKTEENNMWLSLCIQQSSRDNTFVVVAVVAVAVVGIICYIANIGM